MVKVNIILAALAIQSMIAGAFADHGSKAQEPYRDVASHESQQILQPSSEHTTAVEDDMAEPQNPQILLSVDDGYSTMPTDLAVHEALSALGSLGTVLELAKIKAAELDLRQVATDIGMWVEHHPWKAAFYTASAIGFFAPEVLSIPALEALGFGAVGVRAGSVASKIQSVIGPVAARSVFAIWQSARMGGYGVANVNGGVRALLALAGCNPLKDCKGLISDGGARLLEGTSTTTILAIVCAWFVGLNDLFGWAW